jgi:uncharacterized repeat protein (TIGR03803 family)
MENTMTGPQRQSSIFDNSLPAILRFCCAVIFGTAILAQAQTFHVIHNFTGGADGAFPLAGLTADGGGNLYGTAQGGGTAPCYAGYGCGTAFRLKRSGADWVFDPLYEFQGGTNDGQHPSARMVFAPNGVLYGTTYGGGIDNNTCGDGGDGGCGTIFKLTPPPTFCGSVLCPWDETVIYFFPGSPGAGVPSGGPLAIDQSGNLYGSSINGGCCDYGDDFELSPSGSGWNAALIDNHFPDGGPMSGLTIDNAGNLYGSVESPYAGAIYQLSSSGFGWQFNLIMNLNNIMNGGDGPQGSLIVDGAGNLYGTTLGGGGGNGGTVFELAAGTWNFSLLYSLTGSEGPQESLAMDSAGNLYGTTYGDGAYNRGSVFKLSPSANGWIYTELYDFTGGSDGSLPISNVVIDAQGNLYGTASRGGTGTNCYEGSSGCGVVWKITP